MGLSFPKAKANGLHRRAGSLWLVFPRDAFSCPVAHSPPWAARSPADPRHRSSALGGCPEGQRGGRAADPRRLQAAIRQPGQAGQEPGGNTGHLTWTRARPAGAFLSALQRSQRGWGVGKRPHRDAHSSPRFCRPLLRRRTPFRGPRSLVEGSGRIRGLATVELAYSERTIPGSGPSWLRQPQQLLTVPAAATPNPVAMPKGLGKSCAVESYRLGAVSSNPCARRGLLPLVSPSLADSIPWRSHCGTLKPQRSPHGVVGQRAEPNLTSSLAARFHVTCELRDHRNPQSQPGETGTAKGANWWAEREKQAQGKGSWNEGRTSQPPACCQPCSLLKEFVYANN